MISRREAENHGFGMFVFVLFFKIKKKFMREKRIIRRKRGPWPVAQLVRVSSRYDKFGGPISSQGTYKNQPANV